MNPAGLEQAMAIAEESKREYYGGPPGGWLQSDLGL